jgi:hypothetical protein
MFLYARPYAVICPVCDHVMLTADKAKYACQTAGCRMNQRWFEVQLPILTAHACDNPLEAPLDIPD